MGKQPSKSAQKRALFVAEYLKDRNGTKAAIAAGYSPNGAGQTAYRLLKNSHVNALIEARSAEILGKLDIDADFILSGLKRYAQANIQDYLDKDGRPVNLAALPRDVADGIAEVKVKTWIEGKGEDRRTVTETTLKMEDRQRARQLLGSYKKLWTEKVEIADSAKIIETLHEGQRRAAERAQARQKERAPEDQPPAESSPDSHSKTVQ